MNKQEYNDMRLLQAVEQLPRIEGDSSVIEAAERQMQQWLRLQQGQDNTAPAPSTGKLAGIGPYLTISPTPWHRASMSIGHPERLPLSQRRCR